MEGSGVEGKGGEECMERGGEGKGYNVNEFYVIFFRRELLHSADRLAPENGRNINGNIYAQL